MRFCHLPISVKSLPPPLSDSSSFSTLFPISSCPADMSSLSFLFSSVLVYGLLLLWVGLLEKMTRTATYVSYYSDNRYLFYLLLYLSTYLSLDDSSSITVSTALSSSHACTSYLIDIIVNRVGLQLVANS